MAEVNKVLKENGLSPNEVKVYLACSRFEVLSVPELMKKTGLPESTARDNLGFLIKKGLARRMGRGDRKVYAAGDPGLLATRLEARLGRLRGVVVSLRAVQRKFR